MQDVEDFRALLAKEKPLSKTRRVEALLPEIEAALARGLNREQVLRALNQMGIELNIPGLNSILVRARRKAAKAKGPPRQGASATAEPTSGGATPAPTLTPPVAPPPVPQPAETRGFHDPRAVTASLSAPVDLLGFARRGVKATAPSPPEQKG